MIDSVPMTRDLVLVGGGHAHALVLRKWAMSPLPGARLTLVSPHPVAPYTGMLPGFVAGHYDREELDIDLIRLCAATGARFVEDHATGLDTDAGHVALGSGRALRFDVMSLDIGISAPSAILDDPGGALVPVKPMDVFADRWSDFQRAAAAGHVAPNVCILGGGIGGVETALAAAFALRNLPDRQVTLIDRGPLLSGQSSGMRDRLSGELARLDVAVVENAHATHLGKRRLHLADGREIAADFFVSAAGAEPQAWLGQTGLALRDGFVRVNPRLQAIGHDNVFAAGDCAHLDFAPRPKAGVFAVRAAPILYSNLRAALSGQAMVRFRPQKDYLKLVSLGGKRALAEKWRMRPRGKALWRLKDRIDRTFMDQFNDLQPMAAQPPTGDVALGQSEDGLAKPLCAGCGGKVAPEILRGCLADLPSVGRDDILSGPGDDAAVLKGPSGQKQVLTTDHLRAFWPDPAVMARLALVHALGDVWAMGAAPQSLMLHVSLPRSSSRLQSDMMAEITRAAGEIAQATGAEIVGGHSSVGAELVIGATATGLCRTPIGQDGARAGDVLILTRPIGSGTLLAGHMGLQARGVDVSKLLATMAGLQQDAAEILAPKAHAMTDVTGFGLAGHLAGIATASNLLATVFLNDVPYYDGALGLAAVGVRSSLYDANRAQLPFLHPTGPRSDLLFDPQTCGGLLASVSPTHADRLLEALHTAGHPAVIIGRMDAPSQDDTSPLRLA